MPYKVGAIVSLVGLVTVCIIAAFPFYDGLLQWYKFRNPDNLGLGIGFGILFLFGTPLVALLLFFKAKLRKLNKNTDH